MRVSFAIDMMLRLGVFTFTFVSRSYTACGRFALNEPSGL
jgi:hypothetical protein